MRLITEIFCCCNFFSSRRRHTRLTCDWSSDVCSSDLKGCVRTQPLRPLTLWLHPAPSSLTHPTPSRGRAFDRASFLVTPAEAGVPLVFHQHSKSGIPAFAGMTKVFGENRTRPLTNRRAPSTNCERFSNPFTWEKAFSR